MANEQTKTDATAKVVTLPEPEPTSPKLVEIRAAIDSKLSTDQSKLDRAGKLALNLEIFGLTNDEKTEIANIKKATAEAKSAEARNAKIKVADDYAAAAIANHIAQNDKKLSLDDKNAANDTFHKLRETVINAILGSRPTATKDGTATEKSTGTKGETGKKIVEAFLANRATGMTDTENVKAIIASGFSRGTTGAVVLAYQREIGEKA